MRRMGWRPAILARTSAETGLQVESVHFGGLDERGGPNGVRPRRSLRRDDSCGRARWAIMARFDDIVVDFDASVIEIAGQTRPARQRVTRSPPRRWSICRRRRRAWPSSHGFIASRIDLARACRTDLRLSALRPRISRSTA